MSAILKLLGGSSGGWVLLGALLAALGGGGTAGYAVRGLVDAPKIAAGQVGTAQAQAQTAQCGQARASDTANANAAAARDIAHGAVTARAADQSTTAREGARAVRYQAAEQEASHVTSNPSPPLCVDPEPLRQLLVGLRNTDAAVESAGAGPGGGDAPAAAQHQLPAPAGNP